MERFYRRIKNYFGFDAATGIKISHLIYPKRFYNIAKYILFKNKRLIKVPYYPVALMVEVSTICNLKCPGCERELYKKDPSQGGLPRENVQLENLKKLKKILPYIHSVYLVGGLGEPFLNKEFWDIHRFFKGFRIKTGYFSNGMLITARHVEKTFKEKVDSVLISIDSHIKEKYETIKGGAKFEKAVEVIKMFSEYKKQMNAKSFQLGLNFIFRSDNYEDILGYLDFAHSLDVDFIHCSSFITHLEEEKDKSFFIVDDREKERLFELVTGRARELGISIRLPKITPYEGCLCNCLWHGVSIFYNGDVCACPYFRSKRGFYFHVNKDLQVTYNNRIYNDTILGNYLTQDFDEIWNGSKALALRQAELMGDVNFNPCGSCYYKYELH